MKGVFDGSVLVWRRSEGDEFQDHDKGRGEDWADSDGRPVGARAFVHPSGGVSGRGSAQAH